MTDWKALIEEDGERNLYLRESPESSEQVKEILAALAEGGGKRKTLPDSYYESLIISWKDKLLRYPLAVAQDHPLITFHGMGSPVPLAFLGELRERFIEIENACSRRSAGADLPFICHYVGLGTTLVSCDADGVQDNKVREGLSADEKSVDIQKEGDRLLFRAKKPGYMIYGRKGLHIVSPLIKEDEPFFLTLRLIPLVSGTSQLTAFANDYLEKHLQHFPKSPRPDEPITEKTIRQQGLYTYQEKILVMGIKPEEGRDSSLVLALGEEEGEEKAGAVDYHSICRINTVKEGEVIAVKRILIPGRDGLDMYGKEYPVAKGKDLKVEHGENIREEEAEGEIRYIADVTGVVSAKNNSLTLKEAMVIEGNVDYSTGNVSYEKNIHIKGDVRSGFSVNCRGDLLIEGGVEDKVRIDCAGSVKIRKGAIGQHTELRVGKDLVCGFIERAEVLCRGDLTVERNILGGQVSCMGNLVVTGKGLSRKRVGALSGTVCRCFRHIDVLSIGAEANKTTVYLGFNPLIDDKIAEVDEVLNGFNIKLSQLMGKLPFDLTSPDALEKLKRASAGTREKVKRILMQVKKINSEAGAIEKGKQNLMNRRFNGTPKDFSLSTREGVRGAITLCYGEDLTESIPPRDGKLRVSYDEYKNSFFQEY